MTHLIYVGMLYQYTDTGIDIMILAVTGSDSARAELSAVATVGDAPR